MENDMSKTMIDKMVDRFLGWKLPKDFCPDAGISFAPTKPYEGDELGNSWWPVGTNLLTADQARAMIEYMLADAIPVEDFVDVTKFADELCIAVDRAADDIGGSRPTREILADLGPATDKAMSAMKQYGHAG